MLFTFKKERMVLTQRLLWVDALRGFAIVLMVIFHFCYDLRYFGYVDWHIPNGPNWWPFRYLILSLFIFTLGLSLTLAHTPQFRSASFIKRLVQLAVSAFAITIMSLFLFPKAWIYFGILHFIMLATLLGVGFIRVPRLALVLGAIILIAYWSNTVSNEWPFQYFSSWLPYDTEDYVPLFPWLGLMYLGIGFGGVVLPKMRVKTKKKKYKLMDIPNNKITKPLAWMGKHGLIIYLVHQPVLFASFYAIQFLSQ